MCTLHHCCNNFRESFGRHAVWKDWGMGPELHHSILVHSGNGKLFSPAEQHIPPPTQSSLSIPITAGQRGDADMGKHGLLQGSSFTLEHWIRALGFILSTRVHYEPGLKSCWLMSVCVCAHTALCQKTPSIPPNATLPGRPLQEHLAECQFLNSCLFQWMHKSVTWLPQIGIESVEILFLLAVPGAQYFTATTVSHGEIQRCTFGQGDLFLLFNSVCLSSQCKPLLK